MKKKIDQAKIHYQELGFSTICGYCYKTKTGKKGFTPEGNIPNWKINALQVIPGNLALIVDIDSNDVLLPFTIADKTPTTISQSGNRHFWFQANNTLKARVNTQLKIDLLTGDKPVLVPPSHVDGGGCYKWFTPLNSLCDIKPVPEEIIQFFEQFQQPHMPKTVVTHGRKAIADLSPKQRDKLYQALSGCQSAQTGDRSNADFAFVIWGLSCGLSENAIWELCRGYSKFKTRGYKYFLTTIRNAHSRLGT